MKVIYEDNHLIAVYKPAGILVQGDKTGESSLFDQVKEYLKKTYKKPGNVFLGLIHRLDRNVDGIVLFAKTSKGASRLSEQFRLHKIEKIYHAWVEGKPKLSRDHLIGYLFHDKDQNFATVYPREQTGTLRAELDYQVIKSQDDFSLLRINLQTGRHHQIRAQLSTLGHPIVGDTKYGSKIKLADQRIMLTATSLSFETATAKEGESTHRTLSLEIPDKTW